MTVDKVVPCVCTYPGKSDDFDDDGMPQLIVRNGMVPHKQFWSAFCPKCGRGSRQDDYKSPYHALKHWNDFQSDLWKIEKEGPGWLFE